MDVVRELADRIIVLHNGQLVADGEPAEVIASPVVQEAYLGVAPEAEPLPPPRGTHAAPGLPLEGEGGAAHDAARTAGVHTHIGAYHILHGVDLAVPRGRGHDAARAQRRRQDDDAAHDHGPVAASQGRIDASTARTSRRPPRRRSPPRHRLRAREHGHLRRPHGARRTCCWPRAAPSHRADRRRAARVDLRPVPRVEKFWNHPAGKLSGGQKQMLAVARAIVEPRELLLIDEPSKGLAPAIINNLIGAFASSSEGKTILLVEQNINFAKRAGRHGGRDGQRPRRAHRLDERARRGRGIAAAAARGWRI